MAFNPFADSNASASPFDYTTRGGLNFGGAATMAGGLGGLLGGMFGDSGSPYEAAEDTYRDFLQQGRDIQQPYTQMGAGAIPQYQQWLQSMQNPSSFINNLMGQYQQSPYAQFQQQQAIRAAQNIGSTGGMGGTGSTPLTQFAQQNAQNISSQDMNQWLQNVLGVNTQYGAGVGNMLSGGQNAANNLTSMLSDYGRNIAAAQYGQQAGQQQDQSNIFGGLINAGLGYLML